MKTVKHGPERRGSALVMTLIAVVILSFAALGLVSMQVMTSKVATSSFDDRRATLLVQAAVAEAVVAIRAGNSGGVGTMANPAALGDGLFWVDSVPLGGSQHRLYAMAAVGGGRAAVDVIVNADGDTGPIFISTLNSNLPLTLNEGVMTDSYDSSLGTYDSQVVGVINGEAHAGLDGSMSSNGDITVNARATIIGDATPGPGMGISFGTDAYVHGSTLQADELYTFAPIEVPVIASVGDLMVPAFAGASIPPGNHAFGTLEIGREGILKVKGPATIVVQNFTGVKDSNLMIDATDGPVSFYIEGTYLHQSGFETSAIAGSAVAVAFFITGTNDIVFPSATKLRGAYYAPDSRILFASGNEVWGSFAADRIEMSSSMRFHYDEDLASHWEAETNRGEEGEMYQMWLSAQVTPAILRTDRSDPFALLNVNRNALRAPVDAWIP